MSNQGPMKIPNWTLPVAILMVNLRVCLAAEPIRMDEKIKFRATVEDVIELNGWPDKVIPIAGNLPRGLSLRILSANPPHTNITEGSVVTFEDPGLFGSRDPKGKTFDFVFRHEVVDGRTVSRSLKIKYVQTAKRALSVFDAYRVAEVVPVPSKSEDLRWTAGYWECVDRALRKPPPPNGYIFPYLEAISLSDSITRSSRYGGGWEFYGDCTIWLDREDYTGTLQGFEFNF